MDDLSIALIVVVAFGLIFDFTNGFHDAANAIATSVSTRALSPRLAVFIAAVLNFLGAFISLEVAATIAKDIVETSELTLTIILTGLIGTISWNLITWYLGLPTSSSHALVGGMIGSVGVATAFGGIKWDGIIDKVVIPSGIAPFAGFLVAGVLAVTVTWLAKGLMPTVANRLFRGLQVVSASFMAFTHGQNDAQKTMGLIALALVVGGQLKAEPLEIPIWVVASAAAAMSIGTYVGGWRIIRTMGTRIVKLKPHQGFAAEASAAAVLFYTGHVGFPVSTTHTISGAIMGAGATKRLSAVRWGVAGQIVIAWLATIPAAAAMAAGAYALTRLPGGGAVLTAVVMLLLAGLFLRSRSRRRSYLADSKPAETINR